MVTVMRDTPARRESTASGVTLLGTNADLRATFVHAFNRRHRRAPDDNFTGNLSIESKAKRVNIFAVFKRVTFHPATTDSKSYDCAILRIVQLFTSFRNLSSFLIFSIFLRRIFFSCIFYLDKFLCFFKYLCSAILRYFDRRRYLLYKS